MLILYLAGGYHPVSVGDVFHDRYTVIRKLGWGHFSTVWLSWDVRERRFVALKMVKSAEHYTDAAEDEILLLDRVSQSIVRLKLRPGEESVVRLLDHFQHRGPHGTHVCMVFEVLGENLLKVIRRFEHRGLPLGVVRSIAKQMLQGLDLLHRECGIIHTDLKPENILICLEPEEIRRLATVALERAIREGDESAAAATCVSNDDLREGRRRSRGSFSEHLKRMAASREDCSVSLRRMKALYDITTGSEQYDVLGLSSHSHSRFDLAVELGGINITQPSTGLFLRDPESRESLQTPAQSKTNRRLSRSTSRVPLASLETIRVKIADLGNACWVEKHFTNDIQTRQYRAPEVILGINYDTSCDIWSAACVIFELATGDYLFSPHTGQRYSKDEDHIAQMIELLGKMSRSFALGGKYSEEIFNRRGELRHIRDLEYWKLEDVFMEKYRMDPLDAKELASFLLPMLEYSPRRRSTAQECLRHSFLSADRSNPRPEEAEIV